MHKLLLASTALALGLGSPAFASIIPTLSSTTLVSGGSDYSYSVILSSDQEVEVNSPKGAFDNFLTMTGGDLGATTTLVSENSFLTGFVLSTGVNSITLTCAAGSTTCGADENGQLTATLVLFSPATGEILGSFDAQAAKNTPSNVNEDATRTTNAGAVDVPLIIQEPASLTLFGAALVGLGWFARRRKRVL